MDQETFNILPARATVSVLSVTLTDELLRRLKESQGQVEASLTLGTSKAENRLTVDGDNFEFTLNTEDPTTNSCDSVREYNDRLEEVGSHTHKLSLIPTLSVGERERIKERTELVEEESRRHKTQVVASKNDKKKSLLPTRRVPVTTTTSRSLTESALRELRSKIIHYLALHPSSSLQAIERACTPDAQTSILREIPQILRMVAEFHAPGRYTLKKDQFNTLDVENWSEYTAEDRRIVRSRLREMKSTSEVAVDEWISDIPSMSDPLIDRVFVAPIETVDQYEQYRKAFQRKYDLYTKLDQKLAINSDEFAKFNSQVERTTDESEKARLQAKLEARFGGRSEYVDAMTHKFMTLHAELKQIKSLIAAFVENYEGQELLD